MKGSCRSELLNADKTKHRQGDRQWCEETGLTVRGIVSFPISSIGPISFHSPVLLVFYLSSMFEVCCFFIPTGSIQQ